MKSISKIILIILSFSAILTGCNKPTEPSSSSDEKPIIIDDPDNPVIKDLKPVFSITAGDYELPFSLKLTTGTGATIRYTLDGSDPKTSSTKIDSFETANISITADTQVKAYGFITTPSNISDTAAASYIIKYKQIADYSSYCINEFKAVMGSDDKIYITCKSGDNEFKVLRIDNETTITTLGTHSANISFDSYSIAIGSDCKPVIAYNDYANSNAIQIKKWSSGTTWTSYNTIGSGYGYVHTNLFLSIGTDNKPYLAYNEVSTGPKVVRLDSPTTLTDYGFDSVTYSGSIQVQFALDGNNKIHYLINNASPKNNTTYFTSTGPSAWTKEVDFSYEQIRPEFCDMRIRSDSKPVIMYTPVGGNSVFVKKYDPTNKFELVYGPAINNINGTLYLALDSANNPYFSSAVSSKIYKWNGTQWETLSTLVYGKILFNSSSKMFIIDGNSKIIYKYLK